MTDPGAADRRAAPRSTHHAARVPHAQAAKVLASGISTSMVLGIVAYLGHSADVDAAAAAREARRLETSRIVAQSLFRPTPTLPPSVNVPVALPATPAPKGQPTSKPATTTRSSK